MAVFMKHIIFTWLDLLSFYPSIIAADGRSSDNQEKISRKLAFLSLKSVLDKYYSYGTSLIVFLRMLLLYCANQTSATEQNLNF